MKLPAGVLPANGEAPSEALQTEMLRLRKAGIDAHAKIESARLGALTEGLSAVKALIDVFAEHKRLEKTRVEWASRVKQSEAEVEKARIELSAVTKNSDLANKQLDSLNKTRDALLRLFDEVMKEASAPDIAPEERARQRQYLLTLSEQIVKLKA
ncbi:hypothetical protein [Caballeronia calidae]|uniref:hypothetical protein n=1 Tax=Caballeronia calidae TaxID=1777139 RepID=UPI0018E03A00|nr:hypothetical protein [Caballeronia calidae]